MDDVAALLVVVNGETVLKYQAHERLPGQVRALLARMDADLAADAALAGERAGDTDTLGRARFVGMTLLRAIAADNRSLQAATCAWLCSRVPGLSGIVATDNGDEVEMQLIME